jgi:CubicO group peptidase (beta-lactamase class C family)
MYILTVRSRNGFIVQFVILLALWLITLMLFTACSDAEEEAPAPTDTSVPPTATAIPPTATPVPTVSKVTPSVETSTQASGMDYWPSDGWKSSTPEEQGMDSETLAKLFDHIRENELGIHSVTIIRNGYVVADGVFYPFEEDAKHNVKSVTKSVTSALIGIAIEQGIIDGVDQPALSFFPDRTVANVDANKEAMTLEHVLMMATGLECRDSQQYRWSGAYEMMESDDWVQYVLDLPMLEQPGTRFEYCNGASLVLSAIIQEATGMTAAEFADVHLFTPLGIDDVIWPANPQRITLGFGEMRIQPHDMAKIGYLYLQDGQWDGMQILPPSWAAVSTSGHILTAADDYGYHWWVDPDGSYYGGGYAGQFIFVVPEIELVAVFTGNSNEEDVRVPGILMDIFVVPAAKSPDALPPNPDGVALLETSIQAAALPPTGPEPVAPLPEMAQRVSGKTYLLDTPNPSGYTSISFTFDEGAEALMRAGYISLEAITAGEVDPEPIQIEVPLGLDNMYRFTPGDFGMPMGAKGEWEAEDVFLVYLDAIGNVGLQRTRITFEGKEISVELWDDLQNPASRTPSFGGRLAE